jgi:hypothetical protein
MTDTRPPSRSRLPLPDQVPQPPRRRPSEERAALASSTRTATQLSVLALVIAAVALGLTAWRLLATPTAASCQNTVWSAAPADNQLPDQWAPHGTTFDTNRRTITFSGVDPGDGSGAPTVLATVSCFPDGASDAVSRAAAAARQYGQVVDTKNDLSDGGFESTDVSGAIFLEFRRGDIVVDLAAGAGATQTDIETIASAYDKALGGDGGSIATPEPSSSADLGAASPGASDSAGLTHDAPELEKLLPTKIGDVAMTVDSALGSAVLSDDPGGRAATAALRAAGKTPDDLKFAESYDETSTLNASVIAMSVSGLDASKVQTMVLDWFQLSGTGVVKSDVQLAGKTWTKYDLGDEGALSYLRTDGAAVIVITASDDTVAGQAAAAMP